MSTAAAVVSATSSARLSDGQARALATLDGAVRSTMALPSFTVTMAAGRTVASPQRPVDQTVYQAPDRTMTTGGRPSVRVIVVGSEAYVLDPLQGNTKWVGQHVSGDTARVRAMEPLRALLRSTFVRRTGSTFTLVWHDPQGVERQRLVATIAGGHVVMVTVTMVETTMPTVITERFAFTRLGTSPPVTAPPVGDVVTLVPCPGDRGRQGMVCPQSWSVTDG